MKPYNQRKEPTFGEPTTANQTTIENETQPENVGVTSSTEKPKMAFSLHTKNAPSYTFTPVMKRPADRATTLSTLEEQAEQTMSNNTNNNAPLNTQAPAPEKPIEKQNGGFAFAPVAEDKPTVEAEAVQSEQVEPAISKTSPNETAEQAILAPAANVERVIPSVSVEKAPSKYRRLAIVILLFLLGLLAFFLLKPKTPESVETLQEQGSSLPIEFRPVDEEEAKRAEAQAKALQEAQAQQAQAEAQSAEQASQVQSVQPAQPAQVQPATAEAVNSANTATEQPVVTNVAERPVTAQKPVVEAVKKPETSGSVIYQPEASSKPNQATQAHKATSHNGQQKSAQVAQVKTPKQPPVKTEAVKPTVKATPAPANVATAQASSPAPTAVASKTMSVPKGVSLMQMFRENNLNISDVNAMSKVNNVVSNLKVGEKVTVRLDKNNRVVEMRLGSGGKFIRQANGSYLYK